MPIGISFRGRNLECVRNAPDVVERPTSGYDLQLRTHDAVGSVDSYIPFHQYLLGCNVRAQRTNANAAASIAMPSQTTLAP